MPLPAGTKLGPYEIVAPIGAGGMREVYKARDSRLDRIVALKVAHEQFSERFEREARAVAALNHPNICMLYDVGPNYLVMEYIDGRTLAGPLPLEQALKYGGQICDALDAAHRKGIVHRDLKPANILLTKAGIKLLDFGLAKQRREAAVGGATETIALTKANTMLGTLQYMAPEQLQGQEADARSDIFSFGLVLFEMLTGKRPFEGSSPASVIAAILEHRAPSVADVAPASLDRVLDRCLAKHPDDRWQTARDLKAGLEWVAEGGGGAAVAVAPRRSAWLLGAGWIAAAALVAVLLVLAPWRARPQGELVRFAVYPPDGNAFARANDATVPVPQFALSPDGRTLVFAAAAAGAKAMLWLRSIKEVAARPLPGTEDCIGPFWSPDSQWIAFLAEGKLKKIRAGGGAVQVIAEGVADSFGATWGPDGEILFGSGSAPINRVHSTGGPFAPVTQLDVARREGSHRFPHFLPDGRHFLFTVRSGLAEQRGIYVGSLDGKTKKLLVRIDAGAVYASPDYLLWVDGDTLLGQDFDADRLDLAGQPFTVAERAGRSTTGESAVSASPTGILAYDSATLRLGRLTWFDRSGNALNSPAPDGDYADFRLSPEEKRLAASLVNLKTGSTDIWLTDLLRGSTSRLSAGPALNAAPVWSPDGARIAFRTNRGGVIELYQKSALGGGNEEPVLTAEAIRAAGVNAVQLVPSDWSPDGLQIVYTVPNPASGYDLWLLPLASNAKPVRYLSSPADQIHANFSPDSRLIAYGSNETGRYEVYVQTLPKSDRQWTVSTNGGYEPRWRSDGREIYYLSEDRKLMAVPVGPGPSFGVPKPLFQTRVSVGVDVLRTHYVPARDGQRFLVNTEIGDPPPNPITVVLNWTAGLKR
jgi:Tol biopolymer transport system component/tRNA A-37 threonylcarbamoyl transferase component Bud32